MTGRSRLRHAAAPTIVAALAGMTALAGAVGGFGLLGDATSLGTMYAEALDDERPVIPGSARATDSSTPQQEGRPYDGKFHFLRVYYNSGRGGFGGGFGRRGGGALWAHDYPRADYNFLAILQETTFVRTDRRASTVVALNDPELFKFPIAYIVEVGGWNPSDEDVTALGDYLNKGGFLIIDDTRDERGREFDNFVFHMQRALPDLSLVEIDDTHEIFDAFFRIDPIQVIPPYGRGDLTYWAIFEDNDPEKRLMVLMNLNNDIAEYWEFSDQGYYPIDLANEAYKLGVNYVIYGLTH